MLVRIIGLFVGWKLTHSFLGGLAGFFLAGLLYRFLVNAGKAKVKSAIGDRKQQFLETLFTTMGYLSKADGRVSESEIAHTESLMQKMGVRDQNRQEAIAQFKHGASSAFSLDEQLEKFNRVCGPIPMMRQMLLINLFGIAMADGKLDESERKALFHIAQGVGFNTAAFEDLLNQTQFQSHFSNGYQRSQHQQGGFGSGSPFRNELDDAYAALGVQKTISDGDLKKAYRKLMSEYHPDKLMGQGLPEEAIASATERAKEIQAAYEVIKKSRGLP